MTSIGSSGILFYQGKLTVLYASFDEHIKNCQNKLALMDCYNAFECIYKIKDILLSSTTKYPIMVGGFDDIPAYQIENTTKAFLYFINDEETIMRNFKSILEKK